MKQRQSSYMTKNCHKRQLTETIFIKHSTSFSLPRIANRRQFAVKNVTASKETKESFIGKFKKSNQKVISIYVVDQIDCKKK